MAANPVVKAIDQCRDCIDAKKSFVIQGGAGIGKTESLKELLIHINRTNTKARVMCITHTNVAVNEILSRTENSYPVSTIHSFLNNLIKDYKKNIYSVIGELFYIPHFVQAEKTDDISEKDYKKSEHKRYKNTYEKYADKLYQLTHQTVDRAAGKREYDKNPEAYNRSLNDGIDDRGRRRHFLPGAAQQQRNLHRRERHRFAVQPGAKRVYRRGQRHQGFRAPLAGFRPPGGGV